MALIEPDKVRTHRGSELFLILLALFLGVFAYGNVSLAVNEALPGNFYMFSFAMAAIAIVVHMIVRKTAPYADPLLIPIALALNTIGLAMIYRIDLARDTSLAERQLMWTAVGVAAACAVLIFLKDHRVLRRYAYVAMIAGLALALTPLIPGLGATINGARIWIQVGPFSLQPAEFSKLLLAVFFAAYLVDNRDRLAVGGPKIAGIHLPRMRDFGPLILVWIGALGVLISQRDLGTSLLFFGLFVAMLYLATERTSWIVIGGIMFTAGAAGAIMKFSHVQQRFDGWLHAMDPEVYNKVGGSGQLVLGLFGMANGGLFGTGWGEGRPFSVPFSFSDFIFPSLGEELGLTGIFAVLTLYMLFVHRGFRIALSTRDGFGKLLAGGIAFLIAWQCFVVIGGVTRLIPLTGLTTPFLAYGGSSLLANWIIVGLLLRISDNARRPVPLPLRSAGQAELAEPEDDEPVVRRKSTRGAGYQAQSHAASELDTAGQARVQQQDAAGTEVIDPSALNISEPQGDNSATEAHNFYDLSQPSTANQPSVPQPPQPSRRAERTDLPPSFGPSGPSAPTPHSGAHMIPPQPPRTDNKEDQQ